MTTINSSTHAHNPYVGPRSFLGGEQIFGRRREIREICNLLIAERIVVLHSPAGAGKSSLIQAGLIPELQGQGFYVRSVVRLNREPTELPTSPSLAYNRYIFSVLSSLENAWPDNEQIRETELVGMNLADYLERRPRPKEFDLEIFIFDQFEEILTLDATDLDAKHEFFNQAGKMLADRTRWALFSMREDFLAALDPYLHLIPTRFRTTFRLEPLGVEAARQAVLGPAQTAGVEFTNSAAEALIDDLRMVKVQNIDGTYIAQRGPYVEPVQLQVVCNRIWESLPQNSTRIDIQDLRGINDVGQALADYYASRVAGIAQQTEVNERLIRKWFDLELITGSGIRGQVLMDAHSSRGLDNRVIRLLEDAQLVRSEKRGGSIWFELSHDRLIEPVKQNNASWFQANLSLLQRQAALWNGEGHREELLLRGKTLEEAESWAITHKTEMTPEELDYLKASQQYHQREIDDKTLTGVVRWRWLTIIMFFITTLAVIIAIIALISR